VRPLPCRHEHVLHDVGSLETASEQASRTLDQIVRMMVIEAGNRLVMARGVRRGKTPDVAPVPGVSRRLSTAEAGQRGTTLFVSPHVRQKSDSRHVDYACACPASTIRATTTSARGGS